MTPFTRSQLQELQRQTMIYKYVTSCVPVPNELLVTISPALSNAVPSHSGTGSHGVLSYNLDPEPWRCKRTDGKKWRCSRDVAPDQKYCERHSHKNRPRSRKTVELLSDSSAIHDQTSLLSPKRTFENGSVYQEHPCVHDKSPFAEGCLCQENSSRMGITHLHSLHQQGISREHSNAAAGGPLLHRMKNHGSVLTAPPGGPLAEALCAGIASNRMSSPDLACHQSDDHSPAAIVAGWE